MTLRTRIAAVASLSVALAVLAAAVGLYVAVRSDLRGEIDRGLGERARTFLVSPGRGAAAGSGAGTVPGAAGGSGAPTLSHGPAAGKPDRGGQPPPGGYVGDGYRAPGGFPTNIEPAPFGAASGY